MLRAIVFDEQLNKTFYGRTRPVSDRFIPEALAVSGFSREQHLRFEEPKTVMEEFASWLAEHANDVPPIVHECSKRISNRFYSVDVVERTDGAVRIVEIGDGQVSDLVGWTPERFTEILALHFS